METCSASQNDPAGFIYLHLFLKLSRSVFRQNWHAKKQKLDERILFHHILCNKPNCLEDRDWRRCCTQLIIHRAQLLWKHGLNELEVNNFVFRTERSTYNYSSVGMQARARYSKRYVGRPEPISSGLLQTHKFLSPTQSTGC